MEQFLIIHTSYDVLPQMILKSVGLFVFYVSDEMELKHESLLTSRLLFRFYNLKSEFGSLSWHTRYVWHFVSSKTRQRQPQFSGMVIRPHHYANGLHDHSRPSSTTASTGGSVGH